MDVEHRQDSAFDPEKDVRSPLPPDFGATHVGETGPGLRGGSEVSSGSVPPVAAAEPRAFRLRIDPDDGGNDAAAGTDDRSQERSIKLRPSERRAFRDAAAILNSPFTKSALRELDRWSRLTRPFNGLFATQKLAEACAGLVRPPLAPAFSNGVLSCAEMVTKLAPSFALLEAARPLDLMQHHRLLSEVGRHILPRLPRVEVVTSRDSMLRLLEPCSVRPSAPYDPDSHFRAALGRGQRQGSLAGGSARAGNSPVSLNHGRQPVKLSPDASGRDSGKVVIRKQGGLFIISCGSEEVTMRNLRGLAILKILVEHPDTPFPVMELWARAAGHGIEQSVALELDALGTRSRNGEVRVKSVDAAPIQISDETAVRAYLRRLADIDDELDAAKLSGDLAKHEGLVSERERIQACLPLAKGGTASARLHSVQEERARKNVTKLITTALNALGRETPDIERHFRECVQTGYNCIYVSKTARR